jgi:hypothetical protein
MPARQTVLQNPISTNGWVWWLIPAIPMMSGSMKLGDHGPCLSEQRVRSYLQNNQSKKCLPSKYETLSSNPSSAKKKKPKKTREKVSYHLPLAEKVPVIEIVCKFI